MPPHHLTARHGCGPRRGMVWGPPGPPLTHLPLISFSHPTHTPPLFKLVFLLLLLEFFDLLAQPIFVAEIWTICSPVCDSSMYPSRILFSRVYLEYFAAVGDLLSEYACLFYVDIISFDACLVL